MTPQRSTLRISALYHARGMISQIEYRDYRRDYLAALTNGGELPDLPDEWHQVVPGTHTAKMAEEDHPPQPPVKRSLPRTIAVFLAVAALAIGALVAMINLS